MARDRISTNTWTGEKVRVVPLDRHPGKAAKAMRARKQRDKRKRSAARDRYANYLKSSKRGKGIF